MKYLKLYITILFIIITNIINAQRTVTISNMTYINGTSIPNGGTIEIKTGSTSRIQFGIDVNNPNGQTGTLKVYTKNPSQSVPIAQGGTETIFSGTTYFTSSKDITLNGSNYSSTGNTLYAEFITTSGIKTTSKTYNIIVTTTNNDADGDGVPDSQDHCPNDPGPASNNGCPVVTCNLAAPSNRTTTNITSTSATLNWSSVSGDNGYYSQYKKNTVSTWTTINSSSSSTIQSISNLEPNTQYHWRVRTRCGNGGYGNYSAIVNFTTLNDNTCNLPDPSNHQADWITAFSFRYNWTNVEGNFGYRLEFYEFRDPANTLIYIDINTPNTINYFLTNLQPKITYSLRIGSKCADGSISGWSGNDYVQTYADCPVNINQVPVHAKPDLYYFLYEASNNITSSRRILNGVKVELNAGKQIILKPGFSVSNNSSFRAYIKGCTSTSSSKISKETDTSFESTSLFKDIEIIKTHPNPIGNLLNIDSTEPMAGWELTNQIGSIHLNGIATPNDSKKITISTGNLAIGIYFLRVTLQTGEVITKIIIKK